MNFYLVMGTLLLSVWAQATPAKCLLQVDGRTYINADCNFSQSGGNGSFSIGTDDPTTRFFAYINIGSDGVANGYWNGTEAASHAHDSLGTLKRNGACRFNDRAIICAWAK